MGSIEANIGSVGGNPSYFDPTGSSTINGASFGA